MDKIARVRQEIERLKDDYLNRSYTFVPTAMNQLLEFLDTLSEEPTHTEYNDARVDLSTFDDDIRDFGEGFCEDKPKPYWDGVYEALEVMRSWGKLVKNIYEEPDKSLEEAAGKYASDSTGFIDMTAYNAFIAGAEWQASQMPMPEDTVLFQKGVAEGRRLEREDMMHDALEGQIYGSDGDHWIESEIYENLKGKEGDKVRLIVLKEEE